MKTNDKIQALIEAALKHYSHEELFAQFIETITAWTDRQAVAKLITTDELLTDDILDELDSYGAKISDDQIERVKSILERKGYTVLECKSLAEEIKLEAFLNELEANPYQLNLV